MSLLVNGILSVDCWCGPAVDDDDLQLVNEMSQFNDLDDLPEWSSDDREG